MNTVVDWMEQQTGGRCKEAFGEAVLSHNNSIIWTAL